jgi:hypothetical protein
MPIIQIMMSRHGIVVVNNNLKLTGGLTESAGPGVNCYAVRDRDSGAADLNSIA